MRTTASSPKPQRISALDFTKGALVLIMVLYHWINHSIGPQWGYYQYLRSLTPSFIFITGFMISNVYLSKYDPADPRLAKRLFTRGLKLITIFVCLNMARTFIGRRWSLVPYRGISSTPGVFLVSWCPGISRVGR